MTRTIPVPLSVALALLLTAAAPATAATDAATPKVRELDLAEKAPRGAPPSLYARELTEPEILGVGRIARDVREHLGPLEEMAEYLTGKITGLGFKSARPVLARNNSEMVDFLRRGIVDVLSETPLSAVHMVKSAGATILLHERRKGRTAYSSVMFVRDDSSIRTLADLRGRRIAFEDPGSTTACLLPLAAIKQAGLATVPLDDAMSPPVPDAVGYFFTLSESSIATAVVRRVADAGALSDEEWRTLQRKQPDAASALRLIHTSDPVPRAFVLAGPALSAEQRDGLRTILLAMQDDHVGRATLHHYGKVDGFDAIDGELEKRIDGLEATHALLAEEMR